MSAPALPDLAIPSQPGDTYADFCLWEYEAFADPAGRWRSETILLYSFALEGVEAEGRALLDSMKRAFGPFRTVWGIKEFDGRTSWEFYFYDYGRIARDRSASALLKALAPLHPCALTPPEDRPYFMFSIAFDAGQLRRRAPIGEIDFYIGNPGSTVSSGICYVQDETGLRMKNVYFFFDTATQREEAMRKLTTSAHYAEAQVWPAELAWPEMMRCKTVVVANKARNDALYFSRVDTAQLLWFLARTGFRADLREAIARNAARFEHLCFDTGYDFVLSQGQPRVAKASFYGYA
ncbi:hypothetical protein [Thetidibacter halocola]|uniref:Uncharacterized protein n=1 Tax=Thetidibacter halocola TaxID=2827239 RepID=A0A8J7WJL0_9RHOB|nr:hypothetical protein [Thetidibacter halocola]MBS0126831.1 hypothetical protein [Thetidibacter halocola]